MTSGQEDNDSKSIQQQQARAKLRASFLRAISELDGEPCSVITYENTSLNAVFSGWHPNGSEVLVRELETPSRVNMHSALLRTPDIIAIQFDRPVELP